jgi:hypothetical protein
LCFPDIIIIGDTPLPVYYRVKKVFGNSVYWNEDDGGTVLSVQFRVEKGNEKEYQHAEQHERPEGQVTEDPHRAPAHQVGVGIKKPDASGNQEYQAEYHE